MLQKLPDASDTAQRSLTGTPLDTPVQDAELRYNIRRLSHHASIVLWNGGNEWQGSLAIFDSFVLRVVAEEDPSRPLWPISPSAGWASGVCALTGLPNGRALKSNPIQGTCNSAMMRASMSSYLIQGKLSKHTGPTSMVLALKPSMPPILLSNLSPLMFRLLQSTKASASLFLVISPVNLAAGSGIFMFCWIIWKRFLLFARVDAAVAIALIIAQRDVLV
jgi:hypothetical protein